MGLFVNKSANGAKGQGSESPRYSFFWQKNGYLGRENTCLMDGFDGFATRGWSEKMSERK